MFERYRRFLLIFTVLGSASLALSGCGQKGPLYLTDDSGEPVEELGSQAFQQQRKEGLKTGSYQGGFLPER